MRTVIQVPVSSEFRKEAEKEAERQGFSSLQDLVRLFLRKFIDRKLEVTFEEPAVQLSPRAIKRYNKMIKEIESGKVKMQSFSDKEVNLYEKAA